MTNFVFGDLILAPSTADILAVYEAATPADYAEGMEWYIAAHNWCRAQAKGRVHLIKRNAGIVAALSPMNGWANNKRKAAELISKRARIVVEKGQPNGIGLGTNVQKAIDIYNGADPLDVLSGNKVRAFYSTILDPFGKVPVTVDRHAFDIALGQRTNDKARSILSRKGVYEAFADAYVNAAIVAGIGNAEMQAVTWVAWRRIHNINAG